MNQTIKIKRGTKRTLTFTLYNSAGVAINLTDATVYFTVKRGDDAPIIDLGACSLGNQTTATGSVTYALSAANSNLLVNDEYQGEICVVDSSTNVTFYPNSETATKDYLKILVSDSLAQPE